MEKITTVTKTSSRKRLLEIANDDVIPNDDMDGIMIADEFSSKNDTFGEIVADQTNVVSKKSTEIEENMTNGTRPKKFKSKKLNEFGKPLNDQDLCQNELAIFKDETVMENFFQEWKDENQKTMENQMQAIKNNHILISCEQEIRQRDQEIQIKDQEIILKSTEAQIKTNNELLAVLKRIIQK